MKISLFGLWHCCTTQPSAWLIMDSEIHGRESVMVPACRSCAYLYHGPKSPMAEDELVAVALLKSTADAFAAVSP